MQTQQSSLAAHLGGRLAAINAETAGKPLDVGQQKLPGGIKSGIAKIAMMVWKQQDKDDGKVPRGEYYFFGRAICMLPLEHAGMKTYGIATTVNIPLCDVPEKGLRKASSLRDNWNKFRSLIELFGVKPCPETPQSDPSGAKTQAYFLGAMQALCDPKKPTYIKFTTKAIAGTKTPANPDPEPFIFEEWVGLAKPEELSGKATHDPGAGVNVRQSINPIVGQQPEPFTEPPIGVLQPGRAPTNSDIHGMEPGGHEEPTGDDIDGLVEIAMNDPTSETPDGAYATSRLEELAWAGGWSKEQTASAEDWAAVGEMAANPAMDEGEEQPQPPPTPAIGSKWKFAKRTKEGARLKNNKGEEFAPQEVEVVTVDAATETCTVSRDGKVVVDLRSKKPIDVKWEWLE